MITVRTEGSVWLINEDSQMYLRMPKQEMEREPGWWDEPEPGDLLRDLEWHPYSDWWISQTPVQLVDDYGTVRMHSPDVCPIMVIRDPEGRKVLAPKAEVIGADL